jgi:hypothetical protein
MSHNRNTVEMFFKGHCLKESNTFSLTLIKIQPCYFPSEVTILSPEYSFLEDFGKIFVCLLIKRHNS